MPSYANVVGDEASGSNLPEPVGRSGGTVRRSHQGIQATGASVEAVRNARSLGASIYYGAATRTLGAHRRRQCGTRVQRLVLTRRPSCAAVDYFTMGSRRTANVVNKGPLLARHAVAVTLSASRWDENDPVLRQLREGREYSA